MPKNRTRYETYFRNSKAQIARREFEREARTRIAQKQTSNSALDSPIENSSESLPQESVGEFARELMRLMAEHDPPLDITGLANNSGLFTYEHGRKLVRGITLPSRLMLDGLARFFSVPSETLRSLAQRDRLIKKGADPELATIIRVWDTLSGHEKKAILDQCTSFGANHSSSV